ncbi:hypothetical protein OXX80_003441 [Metschnikowia pulcherrima]
MSNLSSTSTEPHEEAGNSFVHSVRKYDLKDQVYPLVRHMDYVHEFAASTTSLQHRELSHMVFRVSLWNVRSLNYALTRHLSVVPGQVARTGRPDRSPLH